MKAGGWRFGSSPGNMPATADATDASSRCSFGGMRRAEVSGRGPSSCGSCEHDGGHFQLVGDFRLQSAWHWPRHCCPSEIRPGPRSGGRSGHTKPRKPWTPPGRAPRSCRPRPSPRTWRSIRSWGMWGKRHAVTISSLIPIRHNGNENPPQTGGKKMITGGSDPPGRTPLPSRILSRGDVKGAFDKFCR